MLHLIFQSPIDSSVLKRIDNGDVIVFHENAVFSLNSAGVLKNEIQNLLENNIHLFVLSEDLEIRGMSMTELHMGIEAIDYVGLVELTKKNELIRTWN